MQNNVIEIREPDVDALYALVSRAMERAQVDDGRGMDTRIFVESLGLEAAQFAAQRMRPRSNPDCGVKFDVNGAEYFVWALGLMTMDWAVEILRKKTRDGHCYTHKAQNSQPCERARPFQESIYRDCLDSFKNLLAELENRGIDYPDPS